MMADPMMSVFIATAVPHPGHENSRNPFRSEEEIQATLAAAAAKKAQDQMMLNPDFSIVAWLHARRCAPHPISAAEIPRISPLPPSLNLSQTKLLIAHGP
jgi:hypothetical protein